MAYEALCGYLGTDLSSMVVMEELGVSMILTGDVHFTHVGMGFQIVP